METVEELEVEWSKRIKAGFAPGAPASAIKALEDFLEEYLDDNFTSVDQVGFLRTKADEITSCGLNLYRVTGLTSPPEMQYQPYGDNVVVVIGTDDCEATYAGHDIGGEFMWTDVWVKSGATWKCVAHHGSKIPHQFLIEQRPKGTKPRGKKWLEALPARKKESPKILRARRSTKVYKNPG